MQLAMDQGMRSLRQDGWCKVLDGRTSIDEVVRNAKADHNLLMKN
jgi:type II secretory ATPase GspE/PulE/Tfp pilus assembly ATPase PilB-like protein